MHSGLMFGFGPTRVQVCKMVCVSWIKVIITVINIGGIRWIVFIKSGVSIFMIEEAFMVMLIGIGGSGFYK